MREFSAVPGQRRNSAPLCRIAYRIVGDRSAVVVGEQIAPAAGRIAVIRCRIVRKRVQMSRRSGRIRVFSL